MTDLAPHSTQLLVDFCGEQITVDKDGSLTFGRAADLVIDDNEFLHRRLGSLECRHDIWWLSNVGSRISLTVKDLTSRSQITLAPGRDAALTFPLAAVQFSAGRSNYELELSVPAQASPPCSLNDDEAETISISDLPLTVDQRKLIVSLAEPTLRTSDASIELPANKKAALRLGWTLTRFNRKLDNVCERLTKAGVTGLRGQLGETASDRRARLVEHAVESGLITAEDLTLLDPD